MKLAALQSAIENHEQASLLDHKIIHTGQHYDESMADVFFKELDIPQATINLGVGSGPHGLQTGKMLGGIEEVLNEVKPDMVLIFGDTNSTVAGALAAVKLHIPVAHIEAGLRSFNRRMPEEINRIASDHISDILLAPTQTAIQNLRSEGLEDRTVFTGDIMYDILLTYTKVAEDRSDILNVLGLGKGEYYLATVHRAENTDDPDNLGAIVRSLEESSKSRPVVFPIHPRTAHSIKRHFPDWSPAKNLKVIEPVGYLDMLKLINHARMAFTDSGGLQKEVFFLGCPAVTLREETEWLETVEGGGNILTGCDPLKIRKAVLYWEEQIATQSIDFGERVPEYFGNGRASYATIDTVIKYLEDHRCA